MAEFDSNPRDVPPGMYWPDPEGVVAEGRRQMKVAHETGVIARLKTLSDEAEGGSVHVVFHAPHVDRVSEMIKEDPEFFGIDLDFGTFPRLQGVFSMGDVSVRTSISPWGVAVFDRYDTKTIELPNESLDPSIAEHIILP